MIDASAPRFGLPASPWVPIAAASVADIQTYVGAVSQSVTNQKNGQVNAVLVLPHPYSPTAEPNVPLWQSPLASEARKRLFPPKQVWVHVDFDNYRQAYLQMGMPAIPGGYFLDHVQNRKAIGLRGNSHPYLRLCPVSRLVNTSGGHSAGGEGIEKRFLAGTYAATLASSRIIYADPMDLTKMLDIPPGTQVLNGVRDTQRLFYP